MLPSSWLREAYVCAVPLKDEAVAFCTDIVPDEILVELGLPEGVNDARAAQILRPPSRKVRKVRKPRAPERRKVG